MSVDNKSWEEIERILRFNCPYGCDGNGSYPEQTSDDQWEQGQCQWCFEYGLPAKEAIQQLLINQRTKDISVISYHFAIPEKDLLKALASKDNN